ncbi:hypothetical protein CCHOA_06175 [Corynebacterium choanae]|uniref:Uncharacterized protein n=1 Tax=Corynebacterium choanae TaxID=1862358 RepID=A0A3G6JBV6_9CORY|nr:hypothetical protein CCHOA_06175 [Corynebacterium choanae]
MALGVGLQQVQRNNAGEPDDDADNRHPVEVLFHHGRTGKIRLDATTEQARQAAALALVEQNEQGHQHSCDNQDNLES